jgi:gamma-glutamyl-gamma-aminobutyrate hydrolase PuuD
MLRQGDGQVAVAGRPLIGLTAGPVRGEDGLAYARLRMTYIQAVEAAGGLPVVVPPLDEPATLAALLARLDGLLLPGGADIDPAEYGEPVQGSRAPNPALDRSELAAVRSAIERDLPTLGICRGQQVINVALGGSLIQHLDGHAPDGPRDLLAHPFRVAPGSKLASVLGTTVARVNSHNHQAVKALGQGLVPVAWADDGTIEGLERPDRSWLLAVQFHPEDLVPEHGASQRLFAAFVAACRARSGAPARVGSASGQ